MIPHDSLSIIKDDITTLNVDAIVNAANENLSDGSGVNGAIHSAAGPELLMECRTLGGCETGSAKITKGYRLSSRYVIHAVGPIWQDGEHHEAQLLASCYQACFKLALEYDIKTIAFPAISCGIYAYPINQATKIALKEILDFLKKHDDFMKVYIVCFDQAVFDSYQQQLAK